MIKPNAIIRVRQDSPTKFKGMRGKVKSLAQSGEKDSMWYVQLDVESGEPEPVMLKTSEMDEIKFTRDLTSTERNRIILESLELIQKLVLKQEHTIEFDRFETLREYLDGIASDH